jgi:cell division protein FtsW
MLSRWWWTVDRPAFIALMSLIAVGIVLITAASPVVAERIGFDSFHFVRKQLIFMVMAVATLIGVSMMPAQQIRRLAVGLFLLMVVCMLLLPLIGFENKGAVRWIRMAGFSLQPSEFLKPCFAVLLAWVFHERLRTPGFPGYRIAIGLYVLVAGLLLIQPDFGMTLTVSAMFALQFFLAGMPFMWVIVLAGLGVAGIVAAYHNFAHVQRRIDQFFDPSSGDNYQVEKSLEAFKSGGLLGQGPGEGKVKHFIPDSHTDFIFAVAGEEFGLIISLMIVGLFAFIVLRGFMRLYEENDMFIMLAVSGLLALFGMQALINMGVAVSLLPAKGMTLPFVSYGGSSAIATALGMGMMLALTRKRYGSYNNASG